uniref:Uncharacterized protein n=1 Tax=uncultured Caudovirales phage TaxID=2100421 RepID=A0A6J5L446_9CAUD|nr:hypothetical protein UFOVP114_6 [uncultured Caudovirales phage]
MSTLRWEWSGDKELHLHKDGAPVVVLRKTTKGGTAWWLHHPDGRPLLDTHRGESQVYRLDKQSAQRSAEAFARGETVYP